MTDRMIDESFYNASGNLIGPKAESSWLAVYGPGLRKLLNWIKKNYGDEKGIYIFENGVSVPGENQMAIIDAIHDTFRVNFY